MYIRSVNFSLLTIFFLTVLSCRQEQPRLFVDQAIEAGITFSNDLTYTEDFNPYTYKSYFNGGGVALGDVNNDGLLDIYFTGNLVDNKLYLNKGNWQFEDITLSAGVACPNVWSSGATFVDINSDGWLDLYVCKSGKPAGNNRYNELFINQGDLTFKEQSKEFGLDITGLSTHAAFFDYDKDGDLDCYVLTNSIKSVGGYDLIKDQREIPDPLNGGNKFLVNQNGKFHDSTLHKGVYTSEIGFGLGITLSDFNGDGWTDIFVSNDFFERDYLYINKQGEGFKESLESYFGSISMGSMGADAADLNNDLLPDLFVTEMLPREIRNQRSKTVFESWDKHQLSLSTGYYHQFGRNVLQMNTTDNKFVELGRYGDVSATDWSWGALMFDFNNDGLKDIFVSNGIYKDLLDRDYLTYAANDQEIARILKEKGSVITDLLEAMPTTPVPNRAFISSGNFVFKERADSLGLGGNSYSNGSAYGDLDNDGDYDLVVNNIGAIASVYENKASDLGNNSISIQLKGDQSNTQAIGTRIIAVSGESSWMVENFPSRGFQSSVDSKVIFGLGQNTTIDSLLIFWPTDEITTLLDVNAGQLTVDYHNAAKSKYRPIAGVKKSLISPIALNKQMLHQENVFVDFDRDRLLPIMMHNEGPGMLIKDLDGNGKLNILLGGSKEFTLQSYEFDQNEIITELSNTAFKKEAISEDVLIRSADFNKDGLTDIYVASGGKAFSNASDPLMDRVYMNQGEGLFELNKGALPSQLKFSTGALAIADFDNDGDQDVFVAERFHTFQYTEDCRWHLLLNDGTGYFTDVSKDWLGELDLKYMATDADVLDFNQDEILDLVISTDWGPVVLLEGNGSGFTDQTGRLGRHHTGWWSAVKAVDIDFDGDQDLLVGNHGSNSFFKDSVRIYVKDFDRNGTLEYFYCTLQKGRYYPVADRNEIISQLPGLKKRILYFKDYASMAIDDLFTAEELEGVKILQANTLKSALFVNENGKFVKSFLPWQLQLSPIYDIAFFKKGKDEVNVFFGGNQYLVKPQFGRYDALPLTIWELKGKDSNIHQTDLYSQIREIEVVEWEEDIYVFTASTDDKINVFKYND